MKSRSIVLAGILFLCCFSPAFAEINQAKDYFHEAFNHMSRGEYDPAIAIFKKCISLDPGYAKAYAYMGLAYSYQKNDLLANQNLAKARQLCSEGADCVGLSMLGLNSDTAEVEQPLTGKQALKHKIMKYFSSERIGGMYLVIFPITLLLSLFFGFNLQAVLILIGWFIVSIIARLFFSNANAANVISYLCALFTVYLVMRSEIHHT
ncbi:MAG: hypothetical protein NTY47_03170 [Candidatus Omnitrophica bacterium]|nr:hypothetical protein [Candidatus Omnitrophota bacterium]